MNLAPHFTEWDGQDRHQIISTIADFVSGDGALRDRNINPSTQPKTSKTCTPYFMNFGWSTPFLVTALPALARCIPAKRLVRIDPVLGIIMEDAECPGSYGMDSVEKAVQGLKMMPTYIYDANGQALDWVQFCNSGETHANVGPSVNSIYDAHAYLTNRYGELTAAVFDAFDIQEEYERSRALVVAFVYY